MGVIGKVCLRVDMPLELTPDLAFAYGCTLVGATVPIWIGSKLGTKVSVTETMSAKDAYMFPIVGSVVLFGLYLAFLWFGKEYVNLVLTAYFLLFGVFALGATLSALISRVVYKDPSKKQSEISFRMPWSSSEEEPTKITYTPVSILCYTFSVGFCAWYAVTKHWVANNLLGISFSIQGVAMISPGTYSVGCVLLGLLFFYDIFWVFGTDVMVTVAKSFDGPIKLLFPKNVFTVASGEAFQFSMLGLGDIVLPGILIALLLRFDLSRGKNSSAVYFYVCLVSYFFGLVSTIAVMHIFEHAQPALLYLVPFCLISSFMTAVARGEVSLLLKYTEEKPTDEKATKEKVTKEKETKQS